MANARDILTPKFQLNRSNDCISLSRDGILFRIFPKLLQFQVDRLEPGSEAEKQFNNIAKTSTFSMKVYGVFGYIKLACFSYLILIEEASLVGHVLEANVFKVDKLMFLPLSNDPRRKIEAEDLQFVDMINKVQAEKAFYFSYDMDLTKNIQRTLADIQDQSEIAEGGSINKKNNLLMREKYPNSIDFISQFAFNDSLLAEFQGIEYAPFKVPCIFGYVYISTPNFNRSSKVDFILISRKDCRRPGRRFVTRGIDREGNAANFVETEHIFVQYDSMQRMKVASLVQTRGSIPLLWSMKPNLKWAPPVKVNKNFEDSRIAAQMHFKETSDMYGKQYLVNLIDTKGSQNMIGQQFSKLHRDLNDKNLLYTWFDFHKECKKMKWENLSKLIDICREELLSNGYFIATIHRGQNDRQQFNSPKNFTVFQKQRGVFRTNCMDCLDRTNVVQGVFSRFVAFSQLNKMDLIDLPSNNKISPFQKFPVALEEVFREGWTNNADVMSYLYTGTPALKTDFTRTGKRTFQGAVNDGINSLTRYYINNFTDGYYHDCLDIATLKLLPNSYLKPRGFLTPIKVSFIILFLVIQILQLMLRGYMEPVEEVYSYSQYLVHFVAMYGSFFAGLFAILKNGRRFIDDASRFV